MSHAERTYLFGLYNMKKIPLTRGKFALVDDEDFDELNKSRWYALKGKNTYYAEKKIRKRGVWTSIGMHRAILKIKKGLVCDHINGNGLDNRRVNLRICRQGENTWNSRRQSNNTSGYKGVYWHKHSKKWYSRITVNSKTKSLGYYDDKKEAAIAYDLAAKQYYGEFARLNFQALK